MGAEESTLYNTSCDCCDVSSDRVSKDVPLMESNIEESSDTVEEPPVNETPNESSNNELGSENPDYVALMNSYIIKDVEVRRSRMVVETPMFIPPKEIPRGTPLTVEPMRYKKATPLKTRKTDSSPKTKSKISLDVQLKNQRIEVICMGCLELSLPDITIHNRDQTIVKGDQYRPDIVFSRPGHKREHFYYIEIDEHNHISNKASDEKCREEFIINRIRENYIKDHKCELTIIRFNPNNVYHNGNLFRGNIDTPMMKCIVASHLLSLVNSEGCVRMQTISGKPLASQKLC